MLEHLIKAAETMLKFKDVQDILKVSTRSVRRYIAAGDLPHVKVGKVLLFDREQLDEWMENHKGDDGRYYCEQSKRYLSDTKDEA